MSQHPPVCTQVMKKTGNCSSWIDYMRERGTAETTANLNFATPSTSKLFNNINSLGALMEIGTVFMMCMSVPFFILAYAVIFDKGK